MNIKPGDDDTDEFIVFLGKRVEGKTQKYGIKLIEN